MGDVWEHPSTKFYHIVYWWENVTYLSILCMYVLVHSKTSFSLVVIKTKMKSKINLSFNPN